MRSMKGNSRFNLATLSISVLFTCFFAAKGLVFATTVVIPSDDQLVIGARAIVRGKVLSLETRYDGERRRVYTYIRLQVDEILKGRVTAREIVIKELGGEAGGFGTFIFGVPRFTPEEKVLLFLDSWPDGSLRVHQLFLGKYTITEEGRDGASTAVRAVADEHVAIIGRSTTGTITDRLETGAFISLIRAKIAANAQSSQSHEARYYSATPLHLQPPEYEPEQTGETRSAIANFTFLNPQQPPRWFEADSNQTVLFTINTTPASGNTLPYNGTSNQIITDIIATMTSWSSVSAFRTNSGGSTTTGCGLRSGDGNNISFNDCDGRFTGSGCPGVLGVGGITLYVTSTSRVINGVTFYRALEGDVSFNPAANCVLTSSDRFREVLAHEMGHAIGLGHSSDTDATMYGIAHFDGRGAGLRQDDINGMQFIYPGPTPTPTPTPTPPVCVGTLSPQSRNFAANGGSGSFTLTIGSGCQWMATDNASWITVQTPSGQGTATINYTVAANSGAARSGAITVAGQTFTVRQGANFADVPPTSPSYEFIGKISAMGVTAGCGTDGLGNPLYCPNLSVTRDQMATFIIRALGELVPPTPTSQRFTDVPPSNIFYAFIDRLAARGITAGCTQNQFCPGLVVTHEQMAAFLIRALGEFNPPTPATQRFADVPPSNIFYAFIEQMFVRGIWSGCGQDGAGNPLYCPNSLVTREQMAALLVRAFDL
jgi:hypothetical protein